MLIISQLLQYISKICEFNLKEKFGGAEQNKNCFIIKLVSVVNPFSKIEQKFVENEQWYLEQLYQVISKLLKNNQKRIYVNRYKAVTVIYLNPV